MVQGEKERECETGSLDGRRKAAVSFGRKHVWKNESNFVWEKHEMRVLLRNMMSKQYYGGQGAWVSELARAYDCGEITRATALATQQHMPGAENLEIVLDYESPACQLAFPVTPDWQQHWLRRQAEWVPKAAA